MKIPEKSLLILTFRIYEGFKEKDSIQKTNLKIVHKGELEMIPEPKDRWIQRLIESNLILRGPKTGTYLIYHPKILMSNIFEKDIVEFKKSIISALFKGKVTIITSENISDYTRDGLVSTDVDCILTDEKLYETVKRCLKGVYFWYIPYEASKLALATYVNIVRADPRTLTSGYQAFHKLPEREKMHVIKFLTESNSPLIFFMLDVLGARDVKLNWGGAKIRHPAFKEEWELAAHYGYSGSMFSEYLK